MSNDQLRLASHQARALAASGRATEAIEALERAADIRQRLGDGPKAAGVFHFWPGESDLLASEARLMTGGTGNYRQAVLDAEDAALSDETAQGQAADRVRRTVRRVPAAGLSKQDTDLVLGISAQRVSQFVPGGRPATHH